MNKKVLDIYNTLRDAGADVGSEQEFNNHFFAKGADGYQNRYNVWKTFRDAGADVGDSYEEFAGWLGLKAVKPGRNEPYTKTLDSGRQTIDQNRQTIGRIGNIQQRIGLDLPQEGFGKVSIGQNRKVTKGAKAVDLYDGLMKDTYVTESGETFFNRGMADLQQNVIDDQRRRELDPIGTELNDLYSERDRINRQLEARRQEITKENKGGLLSRIMREAGQSVQSGMMPDATSPSSALDNDREYSDLMAAYRKNREAITTLEDQRDAKTNNFWHSLAREISNGYNFSLGGKARMDDMISEIEAQRYLPSINSKRQKGEDLTHEEQIAETVLKNKNWDREIQGKYGDDYGAWARAGKMGANSADFMLDFLLMGGAPINLARGVMNSVVKGGEKYLGNIATKGLGKFMLKTTGATLGSMVAGAEMTNTVQLGKTASDVAEAMIGDVYQDKDGNYTFGHYEEDENGNANFVEGGNSFFRALADAERTGISENGSEVMGTFLPGATGVLRQLGLSKIARGLTALKGKKWYQNYSKFLQTAGFNGVAGEGLEEYGGMMLDAIMGGNEWKQLGESKTHLDIWLGVTTMSGILNAPQLLGTGLSAIQYQRYKQATNKADIDAQATMTPNEWSSLRDAIDSTDNDGMADLSMEILDSKDLSPEAKTATMNYISNLQKMRGYSLGSMVSGRDNENADNGSQEIDQAYTEGYNVQDPDLKKQLNDEVIAAEGVLSQYGQEFANMITSSKTPVATLDYLLNNQKDYTDEQIAAAADYYQKKTRFDGALDGALDGADLTVEKLKAENRGNTHQQTGNVIYAESPDGKQSFYVVGGEVTTNEETGLPALTGTGGAVVVKDSHTGEVRVVSPQDIHIISVYPSEQINEYYDTEYRNKLINQADNDFTYGRPANETFLQEDTVTLDDGQGGLIEGTIVMMPNSIDGVYVVQTPDNRALQYTADELNRMIVSHNGQEVARGGQQEQQPVVQDLAEETQPVPENGTAEQDGDNVGGEASAKNDTGADNPPTTALSRIPIATDDQGRPVTKNGKPVYLWHEASVEDTAEALIETTGNNMVMARDTANDMVNVARSRQEKIRKQKPKGDDPIEIAESRMSIQRLDEEQQAVIKHWQDVATNIRKRIDAEAEEKRAAVEAAKSEEQKAREAEEERIRKEKQEAIAAERRRNQIAEELASWNKPYGPLVKARKEITDPEALDVLNRMEPETLDEWVSSLIQPQSMLWDNETDPVTGRTLTGLQSELGLQKKDIDRIGGLIATKAKGGKPFGQVVHDIWEQLPENIKGMYDDQDVRNALIGLFGEGNAMRMRHLVEENRIAEARRLQDENVRRDAEAEMEAWAEAYHLTPDERETFEDFMVATAPSVTETEVINQILAEYDEQNRQSSPMDEKPVNGTDGSGVDGSEQQVRREAEAADTGDHEQQPDIEQGAETTPNQQTAVDNDVPGEPQGIEKEFNISPKPYKTKRGKVLDMWLVQFADNLKDEISKTNARQKAIDLKGWRSREDDGYLLRDEESARHFADMVMTEIAENKALDKQEEKVEKETATERRISPEDIKQEAPGEEVQQTDVTADEPKRLVSDARMEELKKRLRSKLGGQLNVGVDPEILAIGAEMAVGYIERGVTKFADYAKTMIEEVGDFMRPYLKSFYNAVRDMPEAQSYADKMDDYQTVSAFDVFGFDKGEKVPNAITKAQQVENEQKVTRQARKIKKEQPDLFSGDFFASQQPDNTIGKTSTKAERISEEAKVDTNPTEAQKEAGNYQKGHISVDGYDITIENPKGSIRSGVDSKGNTWETKMNNTYGYIRGTEGVDGDHIDVFLSDNPTEGDVFVVDQVNPDTGDFDEHKVMYGFKDIAEATQAYLSNYDKGWNGLGSISGLSREAFKEWVESSHRKTKPFREYAMNRSNRAASYSEDGVLLANAVEDDLENPDARFFYQGKPVHIMLVTRKGEQISATEFSKPVVDSVTLTNGKSVPLDSLMVEVAEISDKLTKEEEQDSDNFSIFAVENKTNEDERNVQSEKGLSDEPSPVSKGEGQEGRGSERAGTERSSEQDRPERSGYGSSVSNNHKNRRNNEGERGKDYAPTSPKARFTANVEAIKMMRALVEDGVEAPTKDQMEVLRKYSGWGGLGTFFNDDSSVENKQLRDLLSDEEYQDAVMSINSAYYTPATVIDSLWDIAAEMGFKGGSVVEGSAGIGNIIGQMPREMSRRSDIEAVEIDNTSGNILKLLYPDAKVHIQGFQDTVIPNGSVDLAITNVPFVTGLHVYDKADKDLSRRFTNIHDFCIAKNIRKLREGGIGLFITSAGTLDKSTALRAWITDEGQADVVGAFRLNNDTFGGTTVTSDIIVVRKRTNGQKSPAAIDIAKASPLRIGSYTDKTNTEHQVSMVINDYFIAHPEMMAGEMAFAYEKGDTFRPGSYGLYPSAEKNQNIMLSDFVKSMANAKETVKQKPIQKAEPNQLTAEKEGRMLIDDKGRLCVSHYGTAWPLPLNDQKVKGYTKAECFRDYQSVQEAVDNALQQQLNNPDDAALKPKLDALNKAYDKFTKRYGTLHKNTSISFLRNDIDFPSFLALENYSETKDMKGKVTAKTSKAPLFTQRVLGFQTEPMPKTVKDAVIASLFRNNTIDVEWIADKLGKSADAIRKDILDSQLAFENPSTGQLEVRYKYLSGNVREKLSTAEAYNSDGKYSANIEELRKAIPMDIPAHLIDFSLGSSWLPMEIYADYLKEMYDLGSAKLAHVEGSWVLNEGYSFRNEKNRAAGVYSEKFHETIYGHQLVAAALNNRPVKVSKQITSGYGSSKTTRTEVDQAATQACAVRVDEIKDEFRQWMKKKMQDDQDLSQRIEKLYNEKFNALVPMQIDEDFLPERFDGANVNIKLRPHQKRGTMRNLTAPTMLAHEVGTGKSFTLITTAMEMRRLGTAKKPMVVVQNATVAQMTADAKMLYPNAKVLSLTEKDRDAEGRRAFYAKIKYNDWDLIIIPQSTFERIPDAPERELQFIQEKIDEKKHVIQAAEAAGTDRNELRRLEKELKKIEQEYGDTALDNDPANNPKKKKDAKREAAALDTAETRAKEQLDRNVDDVQYFDDLGVDALLVDEAHEYKHLGFQTSIGRGIKGIDPSYSKKCAGLYNKTRSIFEKVGWKNVVFATGTPISNTAAEIWTFMKYLMPADTMRQNDIYYFDDFVHNFGNISQMLEFSTSGKFKENTRFAAYVNRPELIRIWTQVADIVRSVDSKDVQDRIPKKEGGKDQDVFLPQSPSLINIMAAVREELDRYDKMSGKEKKENSSIPLTMYGIAKRAAIDPRLVNPEAPDEPLSKTNAAVKEIVKDLKSTQSYRGTVAVFCDNQNRLGYNGAGKKIVDFNIYDDMREKLIKAGVPAEQIAVIKSGMSISAKQKVFDAVNSGAIRVVLGSTQTLGTGVNMQERLHLLIHMDAPDRPMDYTQRNGRIERQGNLHRDWGKTIRIIRFGVEDSLDVTAYQRLKTKSGFIDSIMDGQSALANNQTDRTVEEEEEGLFDNPVAVLSGSQYALKKNQAERELRKYQGKKSQWEADQVYVTNALRRNAANIEYAKENVTEENEKLANIKKLFPDGKVKTITVDGVKIDMTRDGGEKKLDGAIKEKINDPVNAVVKYERDNSRYDDRELKYVIEFDGHAVNFTVHVYHTTEYNNGKMHTIIHKGTSYNSPDLQDAQNLTSHSVRECVEDLMGQVITGKDSQDRIDAIQELIERTEKENEQLQKRVGMEFQYGKELEQARKNVEEYTELMKKEMEEKEAKYAKQQKEAENSNTFDISNAEGTEDEDLYSADEDQEVKDQPVFRTREIFSEGETYPIHTTQVESRRDILGMRPVYFTDLMPDMYDSRQQLLDALRNQYPEYYVNIEDDAVRIQSFDEVMTDAQIAQVAKKAKGTESYVQRKTQRAIDAVSRIAEDMTLDVEVLTTTKDLTGKKARSKGWFNPKTHKIVIVLPNHANQSDVINTLLHEGVAHYGLRKMFGENFTIFLDNVYNNVSPDIKTRIDATMKRNGWSKHVATEEYLARLAERTDFRHALDSGWWQKIKQFFLEMLEKVGCKTQLTDNELRYILWRSYDNLVHPNQRNIFDKARDVQMQSQLKVGDYSDSRPVHPSAAAETYARDNEEILYRDGSTDGNIRKRYNLKGGVMTYDVESEADISKLEGIIDAEAIKLIRQNYNAPETTGSYLRDYHLALIYTNKAGEDADLVWWHEQAHALTDDLNLEDDGLIILDWMRNHAAEYYQKAASYPEAARNREAIAYFTEFMVENYGADKFLSANFEGNKKIAIFAAKLQKGFIYGRQEEIYDRLRQGADRRRNEDETVIRAHLGNRGNEEERVDRRTTPVGDAQDLYNFKVAQDTVKYVEAWQDSMIALKILQDAIAFQTGAKASGAENAYLYENRMHGRAKNMTERYDWSYYRPMLKAFSDFCNDAGLSQQQGLEYLISKSGLERNIYYAFRDGAKAKVIDEVSEEREKLEKEYAKRKMSETDYVERKAQLDKKETEGFEDLMQQTRDSFVYKHAKDQYDKGEITYGEYIRIIETVIRGGLSRKTPKRDSDGNIVSDNYYDEQKRDFSGLTETFAKELYDDAQKIKKEAQRTVDTQRKKHLWQQFDEAMRQAYISARQTAEDAVFSAEKDRSGIVANLWGKINAATEETMRHSYESGLIDRATYNKVRKMFNWYIPLRGWEEDKASDVYTYMGRDNVFNPAVKKTWGRTSQAENPLAYIGNIAVSTILSGHRNQMKQHFLNYVMNHPTNLVSISESWYENIAPDNESPVWVMRSADTAGKSSDEIAQIVNDFNEEMLKKQSEGKAMPVRGRLRLDVHATKGQKYEHVVEVQRAGHTYEVYINGDPKAAQALNGINAKAVSRISDTWMGQKITDVNRSMAMFFTSKNPAFVVSNLSRDLNMAGASVAIKEGPEYNKRFIANVAKVLSPRITAGDFSKEGIKAVIGKGKGLTGMMPKLMEKWRTGKIDTSDETQRLFKEFMDEGGETGFVNMLSVESFKDKMRKEIREMNGSSLFGSNVKETSTRKGLRLLGETFEFYNRCAEDATRFIVYMTSRQMGKSLEDSIADAKDVTLNFNRKGTGALGNAEIRDLFVFVNPAIQALANMYKMATTKPLKFGAVTTAFVAGGAMMAILNNWLLNMFGDDDDKEAYWNLPAWIRKNNFVMWIPGTKNFVTIPLAQEFRVFYGVGEMLTSALMDRPNQNAGLEIFSSVADLVPINPTGNGGNLMVDFAPTMVQPLIQVGENIDFTGKPIWRENEGNKQAPMYTKAYISTPKWMVKIAEEVNNLTGGNEGKKGLVERYSPLWGDYLNNPAVWNHLLQGYFGGMYNTIAKTFDVAVTAANGETPKIYQTPVINRFLNRPVERDNAGVLGEEYYNLTEERDRLVYELRLWQKKAADGVEGAQEHVDEILNSDDYQKSEIVSHYEKIIKDLRKGEKSATQDIDKQLIKESISMYKQQMLEELEAVKGGKTPIEAAIEQFDKATTFAEKNKLRMRIERLQGAGRKDRPSSDEAVDKALSYRENDERASRDTNDDYLMLATAQNVADDARIKAAKALVRPVIAEYKQMIADGRISQAEEYRKKHLKYFRADDILQTQGRAMATNKKLLGNGQDASVMKLIDNNRKQMLRAIDGLE